MDSDEIQDDYRSRYADIQEDPSRRLGRFPGMADPVLLNLQNNMETIIDDELRRSIVQATNPLLEFADLLVAAAGEGYKRSDFVYSISFFDEPIEYDQNGKKIRKGDLDLRNHSNNLEPFQTEKNETDPEILQLNADTDNMDDNDILYEGHWDRIAEAFWLSQFGVSLRQYLGDAKETLGNSAARAWKFTEDWIRRNYDHYRQKMGLNIILPILNWGRRFGTEGVKLAFHALVKTIPGKLYDVLQADITNIPLQAAISTGLSQASIGALVDHVSTHKSNPQAGHNQIMKQFVDQLFYSCLNTYAVKEFGAFDFPMAQIHQATQEPDYRLYHDAAVKSLLDQGQFKQLGSNFLIGVNTDADKRYQDLFDHLRKNTDKTEYQKLVEKLSQWQPTQVILKKLSELVNIQKQDQQGKLGLFGYFHKLKLKEVFVQITQELEKVEAENIKSFEEWLKDREKSDELQEQIRTITNDLIAAETNVQQKSAKAVEAYDTYRFHSGVLPMPPGEQRPQEPVAPGANAPFILRNLFQLYLEREKDVKEATDKANSLKTKLDELRTVLANRQTRVPEVRKAVAASVGNIKAGRKTFNENMDELLEKALKNLNGVDPKEYETRFGTLKVQYDAMKDRMKKAIDDNYSKYYHFRYYNERQANVQVRYTRENVTKFETDYIVKMKRQDPHYQGKMQKNERFFATFIGNLLASELLRSGITYQDPQTRQSPFLNGAKVDMRIPVQVQQYLTVYRTAELNAYAEANKILNFAENSFLVQDLKELKDNKSDQYLLDDDMFKDYTEQTQQQKDEDELRQREQVEINRQNFQYDLMQKTKSFLYDPDADARYNYFQFFGQKILSTSDLSLLTVVFKPNAKGAIQTATDDLNLAIRNRYAKTPYNKAFETNLLMFSPQVNSRFASFVMYIYKGTLFQVVCQS